MNKAEFLHLSGGEQRWVLWCCLRFAFGSIIATLLDTVEGERAFKLYHREADQAAQEEVTLE